MWLFYIIQKVGSHITNSGDRLYAFDDHLFKVMYALSTSDKTITGATLRSAVKRMQIPDYNMAEIMEEINKYNKVRPINNHDDNGDLDDIGGGM